MKILINHGKVYKKIWDLAYKYQDKRDDRYHAKISTKFALILLKKTRAKKAIVLPAIILHDIGWSKLSKRDRFLTINANKQPKKSVYLKIRKKHEDEGKRLAKTILKKVNYPEKHIPHIIEIISGHDTRKGFYSKEDGIARDADKLWRYSKIMFNLYINSKNKLRGKIPFTKLYDLSKKEIDKKDFFYSKIAGTIARKELEKRLKESTDK